MPYETIEARNDYIERLLRKGERIVLDEAPPGIVWERFTWDAIQPKDVSLMREIVRFREGRGTKDELDRAILNVIGEWRKQYAIYRARDLSPGTAPRP